MASRSKVAYSLCGAAHSILSANPPGNGNCHSFMLVLWFDHSIQGAFDVGRSIEPCPGKPVLIQRWPIIILIITMCYTYLPGVFQCLRATARELSLLIPIAWIPPEQVHYAIDF